MSFFILIPTNVNTASSIYQSDITNIFDKRRSLFRIDLEKALFLGKAVVLLSLRWGWKCGSCRTWTKWTPHIVIVATEDKAQPSQINNEHVGLHHQQHSFQIFALCSSYELRISLSPTSPSTQCHASENQNWTCL